MEDSAKYLRLFSASGLHGSNLQLVIHAVKTPPGQKSLKAGGGRIIFIYTVIKAPQKFTVERSVANVA